MRKFSWRSRAACRGICSTRSCATPRRACATTTKTCLRKCMSEPVAGIRDARASQRHVISINQIEEMGNNAWHSRVCARSFFRWPGLGTRFLPASKVVAKEMLPVLDKPLIQYAVDEAVDAGADTLVFVTNRYKHAIADYFDMAYELEAETREAGKKELLDARAQTSIPKHVHCVFVTQSEALGLGHAVLCAKPVIGDEPFGVMLPDDLIWNKGKGALRQMAEFALSRRRRRRRGRGSAARADRQIRHRRRHAGIRSRSAAQARSSRSRNLTSRRRISPSSAATCCRAGFSSCSKRPNPAPAAKSRSPMRSRRCSKQQKVYGYRFDGTRFDCGSKLGLVKATLHIALQDPTLAAQRGDYVAKAMTCVTRHVKSSASAISRLLPRDCARTDLMPHGPRARSSIISAKTAKRISAPSRRRSSKVDLRVSRPSTRCARVSSDEFRRTTYTRGNNPTVEILRKKVAALEGAEDCLMFGSGAGAISAAVMASVSAGDHVICVQRPYSWTRSGAARICCRVSA